MPRRNSASPEFGSAFRKVQQQARELLITLHKEIRFKEAELKRLREEESRLGLLTGKVQAQTGSRGISNGSGSRINWRAVLAELPKQFKASDIRAVRGLKEKRPSEIFAAITRWIEAGMVKRKARGIYERAA